MKGRKTTREFPKLIRLLALLLPTSSVDSKVVAMMTYTTPNFQFLKTATKDGIFGRACNPKENRLFFCARFNQSMERSYSVLVCDQAAVLRRYKQPKNSTLQGIVNFFRNETKRPSSSQCSDIIESPTYECDNGKFDYLKTKPQLVMTK